jgi:hypothetical protein
MVKIDDGLMYFLVPESSSRHAASFKIERRMIVEIRSKPVFVDTSAGAVTNDLDRLTWQVWHELDGQVPRARIRQVAMQVAAAFRDAPVTIHISVWVRHLTREWLKAEVTRRKLNALDRVFCQAHAGLPRFS